VSRGEGELLTAPKPRAVSLLSVYLAEKPVGEPDAGDRHVRFDERGWETERCRMAVSYPRLYQRRRFKKPGQTLVLVASPIDQILGHLTRADLEYFGLVQLAHLSQQFARDRVVLPGLS
jgi:hypothetical protein